MASSHVECELPPILSVVNIDILRDPLSHDLLDERLQQKSVADVSKGVYDVVLVAPPCNTFSRALWKDDRGPRRLRDRHSPWGFPELTGADQVKCHEANLLVRFTAQIAAAAAKD